MPWLSWLVCRSICGSVRQKPPEPSPNRPKQLIGTKLNIYQFLPNSLDLLKFTSAKAIILNLMNDKLTNKKALVLGLLKVTYLKTIFELIKLKISNP